MSMIESRLGGADAAPVRTGGAFAGGRWRGGWAALLLTAMLLAAAGSAGPALGQTAAQPKPWDESAGLQLLCADTLDTAARVFDSPDYQKQLIVPGGGASAYVLGLKALSVQVLPKKALRWDDNDMPIPDLAQGVDAGSFLRDADVITFAVEGSDLKVQPEPPLIGPLPVQKLLDNKPDYVHAAARYVPDAPSVKFLQGVGTETRIEVFFGTWCRFCKHWVPRLLSTLEAAKNQKISAEFVGMDEEQTQPADLIKKFGVTQTPTFIVLQGGKEVGRIEEKPQVSVEADLARILGAH
jgi:thiol-disulfide isomerase/thioredoxin